MFVASFLSAAFLSHYFHDVQLPKALTASGIYNSSQTPHDLPWNTYNYCNAPHVNRDRYVLPSVGNAKLVYATIMMRHHKRTPDNLYPTENALNPPAGWDCTNIIQENHAAGSGVSHKTVIPCWHPFLSRIWNGTCDAGQLTAEGLADSVKHGQDIWSVYSSQLGLIESVNDIYIRTSNSDRTYQVTGGLLYGMDPSTAQSSVPFVVHTQPSNIDSLVPSYSCPKADALRNGYQNVPAWTDHINANQDLQNRLDSILGTAGLSSWSNWYDHFFDTFTSRTCHGHPLPCNATGACVSEADADRVHEIGNFEYNYIWNNATGAKEYVKLTFGAMFMELAQNLLSFESGLERHRMRIYVGHDGSMIRLASGLGIQGPLKWPSMGSEISMEVWETKARQKFVRVFHEGTVASGFEWIPFQTFVSLLQSNVPSDLTVQCA